MWGVGVSQVKPLSCFRRLEKLVLLPFLTRVFHPWCHETCSQQQFWTKAVLEVVQERCRVSPAIRGRVPPPQNFIYLFLIWKWRVLMHSWWYFMRFRATIKRVNKGPVVDRANQRVPGLRPWRPGPTFSPGRKNVTFIWGSKHTLIRPTYFMGSRPPPHSIYVPGISCMLRDCICCVRQLAHGTLPAIFALHAND